MRACVIKRVRPILYGAPCTRSHSQDIPLKYVDHGRLKIFSINFQGKEVLILGGGDGGLLKELLELPKSQAPSFITMVEIDEMVMNACAEFMPSVCGKYLKKENWEGPNYKVINGCAIQFMKDCQESIFFFQ